MSTESTSTRGRGQKLSEKEKADIAQKAEKLRGKGVTSAKERSRLLGVSTKTLRTIEDPAYADKTREYMRTYMNEYNAGKRRSATPEARAAAAAAKKAKAEKIKAARAAKKQREADRRAKAKATAAAKKVRAAERAKARKERAKAAKARSTTARRTATTRRAPRRAPARAPAAVVPSAPELKTD